VEWAFENIEAFGGDRENIMVSALTSPMHPLAVLHPHSKFQLWGQSQGAALTHLYTLAFPDDPLAAKFGTISRPPTVTMNLSTTSDAYGDFDIVSKALGCNYGNDSVAELECMRQVSWVQISEYINRYKGSPSFSWGTYIRKFT
jgi:carboxylesterase type B